MWNNIGKDEEHMGSIESLPTNETETGSIWYVDCQRAMKGIFVGKNFLHQMHFKKDPRYYFCTTSTFDIKTFTSIGMAMMILAVTGLSLYFILDGSYRKFVNDGVEIVMLLTMIIATIWSYYSFKKLDINPHPISLLDDLLLLICLRDPLFTSLFHLLFVELYLWHKRA